MARDRIGEADFRRGAVEPATPMILEQHLVAQRYFGGMTWNMADFMVACVLYILRHVELDLSGYPKLVAWLNDSLERLAAKTARKLREK